MTCNYERANVGTEVINCHNGTVDRMPCVTSYLGQ